MSKNKPQKKIIGKDQPPLASWWQEGDSANSATAQPSSTRRCVGTVICVTDN